MTRRHIIAMALSLGVPALSGCDLPGKPKPGPEVPRPEQVVAFDRLYGENCAGCHGSEGYNGSATDLANPEYQAWIDDASLRDVIAKGEKGTLMPGFSQRAGGPLTEQQIDAVVQGMRARWKTDNAMGGATPPPYRASRAGDATKGQAVYAAACARCHGADAHTPGKAGSILDGSLLALINEQTVRTTIVAGRPDLGQPDWRGHIEGRPLTDDEVTDVSAWLIAQKPAAPGQPYPGATAASEPAGEMQPQAMKSTGAAPPGRQ